MSKSEERESIKIKAEIWKTRSDSLFFYRDWSWTWNCSWTSKSNRALWGKNGRDVFFQKNITHAHTIFPHRKRRCNSWTRSLFLEECILVKQRCTWWWPVNDKSSENVFLRARTREHNIPRIWLWGIDVSKMSARRSEVFFSSHILLGPVGQTPIFQNFCCLRKIHSWTNGGFYRTAACGLFSEIWETSIPGDFLFFARREELSQNGVFFLSRHLFRNLWVFYPFHPIYFLSDPIWVCGSGREEIKREILDGPAICQSENMRRERSLAENENGDSHHEILT